MSITPYQSVKCILGFTPWTAGVVRHSCACDVFCDGADAQCKWLEQGFVPGWGSIEASMTGERIQRRKLSHEVHDRLFEQLKSGEWQPGDHLPSERELMARYGVGRPAIREAMQTLAHSGVIEIAHGDRARVRMPTAQSLIDQITGGAQHLLRMQPNTLDNLKEVRVFLETGMARIAAERATASDIERLRQRHETHRQVLDDIDQFLACDMAFHREIAAISGNPIFPAIVEAMLSWAKEFYVTILRAPGKEPLTIIEHERIIETIANHDPAGAEQAMRDHLTRANTLYRTTSVVR
jgi:DNA-binding FadR family transcriptional regulator